MRHPAGMRGLHHPQEAFGVDASSGENGLHVRRARGHGRGDVGRVLAGRGRAGTPEITRHDRAGRNAG